MSKSNYAMVFLREGPSHPKSLLINKSLRVFLAEGELHNHVNVVCVAKPPYSQLYLLTSDCLSARAEYDNAPQFSWNLLHPFL